MTDKPDDPNLTWFNSDTYKRLQNRVPKGHGWSGVTVGAHWARIVTDIDTALNDIDPNYEIHQVKEKWGGLRYYCSIDQHPHAVEIIRAGEARAYRTCSQCGTEADVVGPVAIAGSWVATLCPTCADEAEQALVDAHQADEDD